MINRSYLGTLIEPVAAHFQGISIEKYERKFSEHFGHPLKLYWRWHGFDIQSFAESFALINSEKSISAMIKDRFGEKAEKLIRQLIELS